MSERPANVNKTTTVPRIEPPSIKPVTEEEIARRQRLIAQARKLRAKIGPIDIPTYELVREGRDEE